MYNNHNKCYRATVKLQRAELYFQDEKTRLITVSVNIKI